MLYFYPIIILLGLFRQVWANYPIFRFLIFLRICFMEVFHLCLGGSVLLICLKIILRERFEIMHLVMHLFERIVSKTCPIRRLWKSVHHSMLRLLIILDNPIALNQLQMTPQERATKNGYILAGVLGNLGFVFILTVLG